MLLLSLAVVVVVVVNCLTNAHYCVLLWLLWLVLAIVVVVVVFCAIKLEFAYTRCIFRGIWLQCLLDIGPSEIFL